MDKRESVSALRRGQEVFVSREQKPIPARYRLQWRHKSSVSEPAIHSGERRPAVPAAKTNAPRWETNLRLMGEQQQVAAGQPHQGSGSCRRYDHSRAPRAGFTLIELVVAIVALAALFAGLASVFIQVPATAADPQIRAQARAIAEGYMEEILLKHYCENPDNTDNTDPCDNEQAGGGAEPGEVRETYDDVWDYRDIDNEATNPVCPAGSQVPSDQKGNKRTALADYCVDVVIDGDPTDPARNPARIEVTVSHRPSGKVNYELVSKRAYIAPP